MNKSSNGIVQAKEEYTKELINLITEPMCVKFLDIYTNISNTIKNKRDLIINYQYALKEIPLWNQSIINTEVEKIRCKCEFLDDLVAAIFVTNVKILSSIKMGKEKQKIQVTMPKTDQFIHKIYSQAAQTLYNNPYIFSNQYDTQKRKSDIIDFVQKSIEDTIRTSLPFRNILQNYLGNTVESESDSEEDEKPTEEDHFDNISNHEDEAHEQEPNNETETFEDTPDEPSVSNTESLPSNDGFFSRPEMTEENTFETEKTVPINNPPQTLQQQAPTESPAQTEKAPMLFPDAAPDDPDM